MTCGIPGGTQSAPGLKPTCFRWASYCSWAQGWRGNGARMKPSRMRAKAQTPDISGVCVEAVDAVWAYFASADAELGVVCASAAGAETRQINTNAAEEITAIEQWRILKTSLTWQIQPGLELRRIRTT